MLRDEWKFEYGATKLFEASQAKREFHRERIDWWKGKKDQVLQTIRSEGLEIDEKLVLEHATPKSRDWQDGARVSVRNDLKTDLNECLRKLGYHTDCANTFEGWFQVLKANPSAQLNLDHQDWLFFFGTEGSAS